MTKLAFEKLEHKSWPVYARDERAAVERVLNSGAVNYWTGVEGRAFENELAQYFSVPHALVLANGTVALEACLRAAGIGTGDEVVVTPRSYFSSVGVVIRVGAKPVFADVNLCSQNIEAESIERVLTQKTRAVLPVHLAGWPCDMAAIMRLADDRNLVVIEDCAQAHGARINGRFAGTFGHLAAFSFCQDKIISTGGEGGAILSSSDAFFESVWSLREDGKTFKEYDRRSHHEFQFVRSQIGSNWRMTEMQSAIGRLQLKKLDSWLEKRRDNAASYRAGLAGCKGLGLTSPPPSVRHSFYQYYVYVKMAHLKAGWSRARIVQELQALGVLAVPGACGEIYREPVINNLGLSPRYTLPNAEQLAATSIALPVYPTLDSSQIGEIVDRIRHVMSLAVID